MSKHPTPIAKRAAQATLITVGGGLALAFALAGSASADTITSQSAGVPNTCDASNRSNGHASIATGNATGVGNMSRTDISQDAGGGAGAGLNVIAQGAGVANFGVGLANSGGNLALGNISNNLAGCGQLAV